MRRRGKVGEDPTPAHLRVYDPRDWPNPACHPECAFWAAVEAWDEAHPEADDAPLVLTDGPSVPWHPELI